MATAGFLLTAGLISLLFCTDPAGRFGRLNSACIGCHIKVTLHWDGIAASRLSKGVHPVNAAKIRPGKQNLSAESCGECHRHEYETWKQSNHAKALLNPIFANALKREKDAWCVNCHAPLWQQSEALLHQIADKPDATTLYAQGVNCAVCHVRNGKIVSSGKFQGRATGKKHEVLVDRGLASENFCAGCHQFNFTRQMHPVVVYQSEPAMQNTVHELKSLSTGSPLQVCSRCHFRKGDHSLHQLSQGDMRKKFSMRFRSETSSGGYRLDFNIETPPICHHYPTGDLFRVLRMEAFDRAGRRIAFHDYRKEVRVIDRELIQDTTLKPPVAGEPAKDSRSFLLKEKPVRCRVKYHLQGNIEQSLEKELPPEVLNRVLFDGNCDAGGG